MTSPQPVSSISEEVTTVATLAALEVALAALVLELYELWLTAVRGAVLAAFSRFGVAPDPTAIWSTVPAWERLVDQLMGSLVQIARRGWNDAAGQLGVRIPFNAQDPLVADVLARTRNLMVRTPDEVYRSVIAELGKAAALGETVDQQAARVSHLLDVTGTENWPARARTVAVTEVHRAYNMGAYALGMRVYINENRMVIKRWDAQEDGATRVGHRDADGQLQRVTNPFTVAREPLMFPGDPSGSAWNVINCRCKLHFRRV